MGRTMRVKCRWNVGAYKAGTTVDLPEKEAYRLEKLGAVAVLRVAPGERMPEPDIAPDGEQLGEDTLQDAENPNPEDGEQPTTRRPGRPKR